MTRHDPEIVVDPDRMENCTGPAEAGQTHGIGLRTVRGIFWIYLSAAGSKLLVLVATVVLARVLVPAEFGRVGFALLIISFMDTIGDLGVSSALIYERERPEEASNVTFIVSLAMGLIWFATAYAIAPLVADFFRDPGAVPIIRAMAVVFVINALGNTHDTLLRRELEFRKRLVPDFAMALLKGLCSVALAFAGWGAWSLVLGQLVGAAAATVALWAVVPWRPGLQASWSTARDMLRYSGKIASANVVSAVVSNADYVIVGRILGSAALGLYTLAFRTPELLITMVIWVIGKVTFPVYAKLRHDPPALSKAFLTTLRYVSLVTIPAGLGLAVLGSLFVADLYGPNWVSATVTLQALALLCAVRSLGSHAGDVYKAMGRADILIKLGLLRAGFLIPAMIAGAHFGILGVALAQLIVTAGSTLLNLYVACRILKLPAWSLVREFKVAILGSMVMVLALQPLLPVLVDLPKGLGLAVGVLAGAGVYAAMIWFIDRDVIAQLGLILPRGLASGS